MDTARISSRQLPNMFNSPVALYADDHESTLCPLQNRALLPQRPSKRFSLLSVIMAVIRNLFPRFQALFFWSCRCPGLLVTAPQRSIALSNRRVVVAGTFFGHKRGRVSFALQTDPLSEPFFLLELAIPTYQLVKEMASGMVRILLECRQPVSASAVYPMRDMNRTAVCSLHNEPIWIMCCNGRQQGYAVTRHANASDLHVLNKLQAISAGCGVIPSPLTLGSCPPATHPVDIRRKKDGLVTSRANSASEVMYMRANFERVIGSKDSEALYMVNPDAPGGKIRDLNNPGLSIFLLRV